MSAAVIVSAGKGLRMNKDIKKQYIPFQGLPLIAHTLRRFTEYVPSENMENMEVDAVILVVPAGDMDFVTWEVLEKIYLKKPVILTPGGAERQHSVLNGLRAAAPFMRHENDIVLIHDGVRPFVTHEIITAVISEAFDKGAVIPAMPATDTLKRVHGGVIVETVDRAEIFLAQTPQAFWYSLIRNAHEAAAVNDITATDDASLLEIMGYSVATVPGSRANIKITTPEDLMFAEAIADSFS